MPTSEIRPGCAPTMIDQVIQGLASRRGEALGDLDSQGRVEHLLSEGASSLLEIFSGYLEPPELGNDAELA